MGVDDVLGGAFSVVLVDGGDYFGFPTESFGGRWCDVQMRGGGHVGVANLHVVLCQVRNTCQSNIELLNLLNRHFVIFEL